MISKRATLVGGVMTLLLAVPFSATGGTGARAGEPGPAEPARSAADVRVPPGVGLDKLAYVKAGARPSARELTAAARRARPAASTPGGARLIDAAGPELTPCEDDPAFLCGTVDVPLDRRSPDRRSVGIHFEVLPHSGPNSTSKGAVFVTCGGPGCSVTAAGVKYGYALFVFPKLARTRDLVFIDQRGVGLSDVIDCPALQAGGPLYRSAAACHDQLGDTADLYSTTDVADDLDDVRQALGYRRIDVFGGSYAGADMLTYAVRHRRYVRSVVLASPAMVVGTNPFYPAAPRAMPRIAARVCGRSPACAAANPRRVQQFAWLAKRLRREPLRGVGTDSTGATRRVRVTENRLSNAIQYFGGAHFMGPGETLPAAAALRRGDPVPLLRLAADADPVDGFAEDLREFSLGHSHARYCVEVEFAWDREAGPRRRRAQYEAAYRAEPRRYGAISKRAWAAPGRLGFQPDPCITRRWEDRPMYEAGTRVRGIPTLVLGGEYDLPVPEAVARRATDVMVGATYVGIAAAGHGPEFWGGCGPELVQRFIRQRQVGDTSCADEPAGGWWVPGSFPTAVPQAPAAVQVSGPRAPTSLRRLATVAAWTFMDSLQHNYFVPGDSVGLRGGVVDFESVGNGAEWSLEEARFTEDVAANGVIATTDWASFGADLTLTGPGAATTTARVEGPFLAPGAEMTVTMTVDGAPATFTVPGH